MININNISNMNQKKKQEEKKYIKEVLKNVNWNEFVNGCTEFNKYGGCSHTYLDLFIDEYGYTQDILFGFIRKAHEEENISYQKILDDIFSFILDYCARYSHECLKEVDLPAISYLIQKGAIVPFNKRLLEKSERIIHNCLEDEVYDYYVRGKIIDHLLNEHKEYHNNIDNYCDWSSITSCHWEYIEEGEDISLSRLRHLKYFCKYIQKKFPNDKDLNDPKDYIGIEIYKISNDK